MRLNSTCPRHDWQNTPNRKAFPRASDARRSALLFASIEGMAVDRFVTQLRCLETKLRGIALCRSGPGTATGTARRQVPNP